MPVSMRFLAEVFEIEVLNVSMSSLDIVESAVLLESLLQLHTQRMDVD